MAASKVWTAFNASPASDAARRALNTINASAKPAPSANPTSPADAVPRNACKVRHTA